MIEGISNQSQTLQAYQDSEKPLPITMPDCKRQTFKTDNHMISVLAEMGEIKLTIRVKKKLCIFSKCLMLIYL